MSSIRDQTAVVIPALNEAQSMAYTIALWKSLGIQFVRVVDNGSSDGTVKMSLAAGAKVVFESQRGYGAAAWRGIQNLPSNIRWVIFSSADGSDRLTSEELAEWYDYAARGFDLVIGNRTARKESRQQLTPVQCLGNRLCCWLIWLGWHRHFADIGSLRLLRLDAIQRLNLQDRGFGWNIEMQVKAVQLYLRIIELPVLYHARLAGTSKISGSWTGSLRAGRRMLGTLASLWTSNDPIISNVYPALTRK